jgi:hypothetical protein
MYKDKPVLFQLETISPEIWKYNEVRIENPDYEVIKFEPYMHEILGTDSSIVIKARPFGPEEGERVYNLEDCYFRPYKDDANVAYAKLDGTLEDFLSLKKDRNGIDG